MWDLMLLLSLSAFILGLMSAPEYRLLFFVLTMLPIVAILFYTPAAKKLSQGERDLLVASRRC